MRNIDVVIIGGGPAGLTAGIYTSRMGLETVLLEKSSIGGNVAISSYIENYPGFPAITGSELAKRMKEHAEIMGVEIHEMEEAKKLILTDEKKIIKTAKGEYEAEAVILAMGSRHKKLNVPGEREFDGKGVSYCAVCDGPLFKGRKVAIVGGGHTAASDGQYLAEIVDTLYIIHRRDDLRVEAALKNRLLSYPNVKPIWNTVVEEIIGDTTVNKVRIRNLKTNEISELDVDGVFVAIGIEPNSELAIEAGVKVNDEGYIIVDKKQETNIRGVYAAGDITGGLQQITVSVGEGSIAAISAFEYVTGGWYAKKKKLKDVKIDINKLLKKDEKKDSKPKFTFKLA
ncbi:MAG: thioredoxin-disulfide reductase [Candidatus Njordarchaeia archaeon]